jgi:hypothetical protein
MKTALRTTTRPAPARRRPATPPTTRQELPRRTQLSSPPVDDNVDETPAEEREGDPNVRFEEVHNTEDVHHEVDVRQDVDAAEVHDDAQAGGGDVRDQERLFKDATEVKEHDEGSTRPRRSPKPNPRYSPDVYDLNCLKGKPRTKSRKNIRRARGSP